MDNLNGFGQNGNGSDWFEGAQRAVNSSTPIKEPQINTSIGSNVGAKSSQNPELRESLAKTYVAIGQASSMGSNSVSAQAPGTAAKKKPWSIFMITTIVEAVLLVTVGILAIIFIPKWLGDPEAEAEKQLAITQAVEGVQARVNVVYADASKTSLIDGYSSSILDDIRLDIYNLPEGADASSIEAEMLSISKFNSDDAFLKLFEGESYNISSEFVESACNYVQTDMLTYTVSGLQSTMKTRVNTLLNERTLYFRVLSELQAVDTKGDEFDAEGYREVISGISHIPNQVELLAYVDLVVAKINSSKAATELSEIVKEIHGEPDEELQKKISAAQEKSNTAKDVVKAMETAYVKAKEDSANILKAQVLFEVLPSTGNNTTIPPEGEGETSSEGSSTEETSNESGGEQSSTFSTESTGSANTISSGNALEDI